MFIMDNEKVPPTKTPDTKKELQEQTKKWLTKLEVETPNLDKRSSGFMPKKDYDSLVENLMAYVKDARHFMKEDDWVRAFEAVIYAWGILETAERVGIMRPVKRE